MRHKKAYKRRVDETETTPFFLLNHIGIPNTYKDRQAERRDGNAIKYIIVVNKYVLYQYINSDTPTYSCPMNEIDASNTIRV